MGAVAGTAGGTGPPAEARARALAQLLREFFDAYRLFKRLEPGLRERTLPFAELGRLVADTESSLLFRLKESSHALFRGASGNEGRGEELLDALVGSLFHEAMKLREGYYQCAVYGPRLEALARDRATPRALVEAFRSVVRDAEDRTRASLEQTAALFAQTREHLAVLLAHHTGTGLLARALLEERAHAEAVFGEPLERVLERVYGSASEAYRLAIGSLLESGHFDEAEALLERARSEGIGVDGVDPDFVRGMARLCRGLDGPALRCLEAWLARGAPAEPRWRALARELLEGAARAGACEAPRVRERLAEIAAQLAAGP